jgi:hypothetical protein
VLSCWELSQGADNGAGVGDLVRALIHTWELNKPNPFDYPTELQKQSEQLNQKPSERMPWNYHETCHA